jgi:hypothetical protein
MTVEQGRRKVTEWLRQIAEILIIFLIPLIGYVAGVMIEMQKDIIIIKTRLDNGFVQRNEFEQFRRVAVTKEELEKCEQKIQKHIEQQIPFNK